MSGGSYTLDLIVFKASFNHELYGLIHADWDQPNTRVFFDQTRKTSSVKPWPTDSTFEKSNHLPYSHFEILKDSLWSSPNILPCTSPLQKHQFDIDFVDFVSH